MIHNLRCPLCNEYISYIKCADAHAIAEKYNSKPRIECDKCKNIYPLEIDVIYSIDPNYYEDKIDIHR